MNHCIISIAHGKLICIPHKQDREIFVEERKEEKSYKCSYCRASFLQKHSLVVHERTHTGEQPYTCTFCSKCFSQSCNLRAHLRIHTGERPFRCHLCNYSFNQSSNLKTHLKLHERDQLEEKSLSSPEQPRLVQSENGSKEVSNLRRRKTNGVRKLFKCLYCKSLFGRRSKLEEHERIHTGEKPFRCTICNHRSSQKANLNKHLMTHTGEKPFKCTICAFSATQKSHLVAHERTHLKNQMRCSPQFLEAPMDLTNSSGSGEEEVIIIS